MEIELGTKVQDKITGFVGTATSRVEYINGCVQYCVVPTVQEDGKMPIGEYIDVSQLEPFGDEPKKIAKSDVGGPQRYAPLK